MRALMRALAGAGLASAILAAGPAAAQQAAGGDAYARIQKLEEEIRRLNGRVELLENQLRLIAEDGGRRLNDVEFRLTELEGGDVSVVGEPIPLGREGAAPAGAPAVAVTEQAAFDAARAALQEGDAAKAEALLAAFLRDFGDGPLADEARLLLGRAQLAQNKLRPAAETFLAATTAAPDGPLVAEHLLELGRTLALLGQRDEACLTFDELLRRRPDSAPAEAARKEREGLGCP
ncbi:TolA-binding protein [Oceanicella actignis]|nr:TolA-binding protein [Oceanicella actignis]